ncbi:putative ubiquitin-like-specific protease 2B [Sesamum angolense]|uniref:Ubiquitin-like-specific protease 2B n=1 Tax=Sesamum angolense TaxID=2727404 RepID=A0AAE2BJI8_9LAMI|nr:putative ubiquitin-like-specific protease 2B [Sesamum angolense]
MKSPRKSLDVFEFKEEDELTTEMAVEKFAHKFGNHVAGDGEHSILDHGERSTDSYSGTELQSKENDTGICGVPDAVNIDYNHGAIETEDYAKELPEMSHVLQNDFKRHVHDAEDKSNTIEYARIFAGMECSSSSGATVQLEDHSNCVFPVSSCNDKSLHLSPDAYVTMNERSPSAITNNNVSSDGPSPDNCFSGWNLGDGRVEIVLYADYLNYCGRHYLDCVVSFTRSSVEARSKTIDGDEGAFHIHVEIKDIVKIESQWSARNEAGTINIYFISKDAVHNDIVRDASGLHELKFPAVDSSWYEKQEAIESLDVRYKALWNVLLDTGMEKCSTLPEEEAKMLTRSYFPNFDKPFEDVVYPKGDPDAVSISKRDVDLLLPDTFVNDTIIDFYIKYLKTRQNAEDRSKFHFFNSFFFRKLADLDKDPSSAFDGKAAFQRVRKWTRKVNLLEKDFIFIPVNYNYHWSLIVICYFGEVASYEGKLLLTLFYLIKDYPLLDIVWFLLGHILDVDNKSVRVPCILHMDSFRGNHAGLKDLIQSYLWEEWKERQKGTGENLYSKFRNLKFIPLELPQQQNLYDCGLFLLHYVELFLEEVPPNFSIYKITPSSKFLQADWFPPGEASMKRAHIERLINDLLDTQSEDCCPPGGNGMHFSPEGPNSAHGYENGVEFSAKSGSLRGCHESSLHQVEQGIEMTLLPASSIRNAQCNQSSGLVLKELFKQASASETFDRAAWGAFEGRASLHEFKRPVSLSETFSALLQEEFLGGRGRSWWCFVPTELAEPVFQQLDGVTPEAPVFPHSSGDFRLEPIHQPTSENVASSPATSGELLNAEDSRGLVEIGDQNGDSFFMKHLPGFCQEANQLQPNHASSHEGLVFRGALTSDEKLDSSEHESPFQIVDSKDDALASKYQGSGGEELLPESDEQRAAKRIRIMPHDSEEDVAGSLSEDLHL